MTRQYDLLAGVCCVSGIWEAKSLSVLVFLPSLYLYSVACRLGPGRVVPVQGHYSSLTLYGGDTRISYTAH